VRILLLFLLASCGMFQSRKEIISVDSIPSGVEVYKRKDKSYVGKTPIFLEVEKNSTDSYLFKNNGVFYSKSETPREYCNYKRSDHDPHLNDKGHRDVEDVIKVINPVTLVNGAKYECINGIRAKLDFKKPPEEPCKILVAIPPRSNFFETSLEIYQEYKKQIFDPNKSACDKIISPFQAEEYFSFLGIDHMFPPEDLSEMDVQKIFKIGYKFKATHIVFLPHEEKDNLLRINPRVYNIHEGLPVHGPLGKSFSTGLKDGETNWLLNFFLSSFRIIPNGVAIQANTNNQLKLIDSNNNNVNYDYSDLEMGITLDDIQFPAEKWAFNFRTVPVLVFAGWANDKNMKISGLTLDFKLYVHAPFGGVFVARAGLGGAYVDVDYPPAGYNSGDFSFLTDVGVQFYFFATDRIYGGLGYKRYFLPNNSITLNGYSISGESHIFFEIGYFWPELRMGARSLFQ
jgi:hypothetical protein